MQPVTQIRAGQGRILARCIGGQAVVEELAASYPLKLLSPRTRQPSVSVVYMLAYGGGLVAGDQVHLRADALDGANLVLLTQGSTKVFKTRPGDSNVASALQSIEDGTSQHLDVFVGPQSAIFLLPDPISCFRDAEYKQTQVFRLSTDSSAVLLDWITSGRKAMGEDWSFTRYHSLNEMWVDDRRVARDALLLEDRPDGAGKLPTRTLSDRLKPYSCYATVLMYGSLTASTRQALREEYGKISLFKQAAPPDMIWSFASIANDKGCILRIAATETETVQRWLKQSLGPLEDILGVETYRNAFR